jgi:putative copper resistance protein D
VIEAGIEFLAHAVPGDVPPPLTPLRVLTGWSFEPVPLAFALLAGGLYLWGVRRLRARGDAWSPWRTFLFLGPGLGTFVLATQSALATYDTVLLSVHMVQHMLLNMIAPIFLALGAPVTVALRTLPVRERRALLRVIHSRIARVLTFPAVAGVIFVANPFVLYLTGAYEATLRSGFLHDVSHVHFLAVGCLWFWPLLSIDPLPNRPAYPLRLLAVFATMPFHAWLGIVIMSMSSVIAGEWYEGLGRTWGASPLSDQRTAGGILWSSGDIVGLIVFAALFVQWMRASEREAAREDRRLDRLEALEAQAQAAEAPQPGDRAPGAADR